MVHLELRNYLQIYLIRQNLDIETQILLETVAFSLYRSISQTTKIYGYIIKGLQVLDDLKKIFLILRIIF